MNNDWMLAITLDGNTVVNELQKDSSLSLKLLSLIMPPSNNLVLNALCNKTLITIEFCDWESAFLRA